MRIALDAYGSDNAPFPEVEGAILAIKDNFCEKVYLTGKEEDLKKELDKYFYDKKRIEIIPTSQVITMEDEPSISARSKKDSSLVIAIKAHKDGIADAVVSAGNTGAAMAASTFAYGRVKNVLRPAIAILLPGMWDNPKIVLDLGANVDCVPEHLVQFAELGSLYYRFLFDKENPKVSLLNIGSEAKKGNELAKKTYKLLEELKSVNFVGNVEGKEILTSMSEVIVCDGFVGNVMLKTLEGTIYTIFKVMKEQMKKDWVAKLGALLSYPVFSYLKKKMNHSEYGGALLVGLNGYSIIAHGSSNSYSIKNAIKFAVKIRKSGFVEHSQQYFQGLDK